MSLDTAERTDNLIRTSIQLSPEHREQLKRTARERDRSMAYIMRQALDQYFDAHCDDDVLERKPDGARS